jgi:hypothetical protein
MDPDPGSHLVFRLDPDPGSHLVFRLDPDPHKTDADMKHWFCCMEILCQIPGAICPLLFLSGSVSDPHSFNTDPDPA